MLSNSEKLFQFCTSGTIDDLLHKCGVDLTHVVNSSKISDLESLTERIDTLSNIIRLSSIVIESNIPSHTLVATKSANLDIKTASLQVLSDYTRLPQSKIIEIITNSGMIGEKLWDQYVNENEVTEEILNNYYNQCGNYNLYLERYFSSLNISLATALIGYIALVAHEMGGKCFDFGAGIGNLSSTVAKLGHENVYMVETDQKQLDFVKWKDKKCGINNITYIGLDEIEHFFSLQESFQFGAAIELLEHVIDPIGLMEKLGSLIAPGGYLFLIASFHVYPHAGHLQSNVQYTDKEDEILKPFGFKRVNFDNPAIPFLFNWKLFQKEI